MKDLPFFVHTSHALPHQRSEFKQLIGKWSPSVHLMNPKRYIVKKENSTTISATIHGSVKLMFQDARDVVTVDFLFLQSPQQWYGAVHDLKMHWDGFKYNAYSNKMREQLKEQTHSGSFHTYGYKTVEKIEIYGVKEDAKYLPPHRSGKENGAYLNIDLDLLFLFDFGESFFLQLSPLANKDGVFICLFRDRQAFEDKYLTRKNIYREPLYTLKEIIE